MPIYATHDQLNEIPRTTTEFLAGSKWLVYRGCITYDTFERTHYSKYCYFSIQGSTCLSIRGIGHSALDGIKMARIRGARNSENFTGTSIVDLSVNYTFNDIFFIASISGSSAYFSMFARTVITREMLRAGAAAVDRYQAGASDDFYVPLDGWALAEAVYTAMRPLRISSSSGCFPRKAGRPECLTIRCKKIFRQSYAIASRMPGEIG